MNDIVKLGAMLGNFEEWCLTHGEKSKRACKEANKMKQTIKCPKCGKRLKILSLKGERWLSHTYSFSHVMHDKPMCDYSERLTK